MSVPNPPPYGYQPPYPYQPRPPKRRPSAWWFLPGGLALVVAAVGAVFFVLMIVALSQTDGYIDVDGQVQAVALNGTGEHMLFHLNGEPAPACTATDATGTVILEPLSTTQTELTVNGASWYPFASFTTTTTSLDVSCTGIGSQVRVGAPTGRDQFLRIGGTAIGTGIFGLAGLAGTITVAVLFFSRRPRSVTG